MRLRENVANVNGPHRAEEVNAVVQLVAFAHLKELDEFGAVAADEKTNGGEPFADEGDGRDEEIDAFAVGETGDDNDRDCEN